MEKKGIYQCPNTIHLFMFTEYIYVLMFHFLKYFDILKRASSVALGSTCHVTYQNKAKLKRLNKVSQY
jgi:hypothetical protein